MAPTLCVAAITVIIHLNNPQQKRPTSDGIL